MNRRLGLVVGVLSMCVIAFASRQNGLLPEGWVPRPRTSPHGEEPDPEESGAEVVDVDVPAAAAPRRSTGTRRGRLLGAPPLAEVHRIDDAVHGQINGQVLDRVTSEPVPNATLTFRQREQRFEVTSDDQGRFGFSAPREGSFTLEVAQAEGYYPHSSALADGEMLFVAADGQSIDAVHIRLEAITPVRVFVHGPDGALLPSVVRVLGETDDLFEAPMGDVVVRAREDAILEATSRARGGPRTLGHGRLSASAILTGALHIHTRPVAPRDTVLRGQVLSLLGSEPLCGARVDVESESSEGSTRVARLIADDEGYFVYAGDAPGPFSIWARAPGSAMESRTRVTRDAQTVLFLSEEASVEGRVLDEAGNPIPSFVVFAEAHVGTLERHLRAEGSTFNAHGDFRLGGLSSGGYTITAAAAGFAPQTRDVLLARGDTARAPDFRLRRGADLDGLVRGAGGAPLAGARVQVESAVEGTGLPLTAEAQTDDQGAFRFEGLSPGRVVLTVAGAGYHPRVIVTQTAGAPIDVTLQALADGEDPRLDETPNR